MKWYDILIFVAAATWLFVTCNVVTGCGEKPYDPDCANGCDQEEPESPPVVYFYPEAAAGRDGTSCSVSRDLRCADIKCGEDTARVCDGDSGASGADGKDGLAGRDGHDGSDAASVEVVTPCPETAGLVQYPERLIRIAGGGLVAFLSHPDYMQQRLVVLVLGETYVTTDGRNCQFTAE
jgi:hypothetical protein